MIRIISTFHVIILHIVIISNTASITDISKFRRDHFWIVSSALWSRGNSTSLAFPLVLLLTFLNRLIFCGFMWPVTCVTGWQGGLSLISASASTWEKYSVRKKNDSNLPSLNLKAFDFFSFWEFLYRPSLALAAYSPQTIEWTLYLTQNMFLFDPKNGFWLKNWLSIIFRVR